MAESSKLVTRTEKNRQKWRQLVSEWEAGDLNPAAFCKKNGLDTSQFGYYRKALARPQPAKVLPIEVSPKPRPKRPLVEPLTLYLSDEVKLKIPLPCDTHVLQSIFLAARGV